MILSKNLSWQRWEGELLFDVYKPLVKEKNKKIHYLFLYLYFILFYHIFNIWILKEYINMRILHKKINFSIDIYFIL